MMLGYKGEVCSPYSAVELVLQGGAVGQCCPTAPTSPPSLEGSWEMLRLYCSPDHDKAVNISEIIAKHWAYITQALQFKQK